MAPRKSSDEWRKRANNADQSEAESKKRKRNDNFEPEMQFLLRVPTHLADQVRSYADATPEELEASGGKMSIEFDDQFRNVKLDVNGTQLKGRVVDLPCIIEAHKTVDKRTVYKTNDISQLVICEEVPADDAGKLASNGASATASISTTGETAPPLSAASAAASALTATSSKSYQWPHGITPPMRNVRKRRFRRTLLQRDAEVNDLEKELRRIVQQDNEAVNFSWKIVYDDLDGQQKTQIAGEQLAGSGGATTAEDVDDSAIVSGRLSADEDSGAAAAGDRAVEGDLLNDDSNLSLSSGDSENLDDDRKAYLKRLAEENTKNLSRDLFGDFDSSSEDGD